MKKVPHLHIHPTSQWQARASPDAASMSQVSSHHCSEQPLLQQHRLWPQLLTHPHGGQHQGQTNSLSHQQGYFHPDDAHPDGHPPTLNESLAITTSPMTAWTTPRITAPVAPPPRDPGLTTEDPAMPSSTIQRGPTGRRGRKSTWPHKYTMTMLSPVLKMQWSHSFFYNSITTLYLLVAEQQHFCLESYSENNIP